MTTLVLDHAIITDIAKDIALKGNMEKAFSFLTEGITDLSSENAYSILNGTAKFSGLCVVEQHDEEYKARIKMVYTQKS